MADDEEQGKEILHIKARILLENGANPNYIDLEEGVSPMHIAAGLGSESLCLLLQYNGDPNIRVEDGTTPVHVSSIWGVAECMQILLANGGDPYLTDQDGLSAVDFACKYQHDDVVLVLKQYKYDLNLEDEQTMTPKYTFKRLSSDILNGQPIHLRSENSMRNSDENSAYNLEDSDPDSEQLHNVKKSSYESTEIRDNLRQFARRRRSSVYLESVQKQLDRYITSGSRTHLVDVTSPDHPYIDVRSSLNDTDTESGDRDTTSNEDSLCLHLSSSTIEDQSCDSFVTCNGEDSDEMKQGSRQDSFSPQLPSTEYSPWCENVETVKKNPTFFENSKLKYSKGQRHKSFFSDPNSDIESDNDREPNSVSRANEPTRNGRNRSSKYCRRMFEPLVETQDLYQADFNLPDDNFSHSRGRDEKCDFCGGIAERNVEDGTVCHACEELGLELDRLVGESQDNHNVTMDRPGVNSKSVYRNSNVGRNLTNKSRSKHLNDTDAKYVQKLTDKLERTKLIKEAVTHKEHAIVQMEKANTVNQIASNTQSCPMRSSEAPNHFEDSILSSIGSTVNDLDKGCIWNDSVLTVDDTFIDKEQISPQCMPNYSVNIENVDKIHSDAQKLHNKRYSRTSDQENISFLEYDDLWTQVEECKHKRLAHKDRRAILDTGFCGRESMSSIFSDGSTVDYVYTDKENGITLVERRIPSVCGSQGSRRSVDSQFSLNTDVDAAVNECDTGSDSSQDTVLYNWRDNAMIMSRDSWRGDSCQTGSQSLSQDLLKLNNVEIRKRLSNHGDDPGPVTPSTRQSYIKRLNQYENDPNYKHLSHRLPDYPPELRQALSGNWDLSDMPALELKMVAAFQNPDRHRRWREGTLKSSFNYILLDPRITKYLPNRSCNMSDQDVFRTFITAIFYIGKGKRARPYSHLYEAIKQQQKKADKVSKKVRQILDIWDSGLGVVSLHCFQSVIPVEAYTREACLVDAIGLHHLTNMKRGDYYGVSVTFTMKEKRMMGVYLLKKALQIFLAEGERQIAPLDIKND